MAASADVLLLRDGKGKDCDGWVVALSAARGWGVDGWRAALRAGAGYIMGMMAMLRGCASPRPRHADSTDFPRTSPGAMISRPYEETCFRNSPEARHRVRQLAEPCRRPLFGHFGRSQTIILA